MANKPLNKMSRDIAKMFSAPKKRAPDAQRKQREEAKRLAAEFGIEIEKLDGGFNVWPQAAIADTDLDKFSGDHFCNDWKEVNYMVAEYASIEKSVGRQQ